MAGPTIGSPDAPATRRTTAIGRRVVPDTTRHHTDDMLTRRLVVAAWLDVLVVMFFVVAGRAEHEEGMTFTGISKTAAPFLVGLGVAWLVARAWRRPFALATGLTVWPLTLLVGMLVRRWGFDEGTATSFVIVATAFLGFCLVGWRLVARSVAKPAAAQASGALSRR